jgi:hypothetical protein
MPEVTYYSKSIINALKILRKNGLIDSTYTKTEDTNVYVTLKLEKDKLIKITKDETQD